MSKTILATCGNDLRNDEYCTERLYMDTILDTPTCPKCQKRGNDTHSRRPRVVNAARMRELADAMASHECWSHEDEAVTLLAYAAARVEDIERLESDLTSQDLEDHRTEGETMSAFVMRLLNQKLSRICDLQQRLRTIEATAPLGQDQATLHAG